VSLFITGVKNRNCSSERRRKKRKHLERRGENFLHIGLEIWVESQRGRIGRI